jgi:hypothetical protein
MIPPFDDLDVFLADFSEAVLKGEAGQETTIRAIFDNESYFIEDGYAAVATVQPKLTCKTSDVADFVEGMRFVVGGVVYRGKKHTQDGHGFSEVELFRA